jgi:hypothetical protein
VGAALAVSFIHHRYAHAAVEIDPAITKRFGSSLKGRLIVPSDAEYNSARRIWNWRYDQRPAMIARCAGTDDVRPDRVAVLKEFVRRFSPMSWSGSRATIMAASAKLLDELEGYSDPTFIEFVAQEKVRLGKEIETERRAENLADKSADERFE